MYSDRRGYGQKPPRKNLPDKRPPDKSPREQFRENLLRRLLSGFFVLDLLKIGGGGPRCVTYFRGSREHVTSRLHIFILFLKCDRGTGSKLAKNSATYFMDGPLD